MTISRLPRRAFLAATAGSLTVASGALAAPLQRFARPSLGFSLYGMKTLALDVALRTCAEVGYSHVEFSLNAGYVTEPSAFTPDSRRSAAIQLQNLKLALPCLMVLMSLKTDDPTHTKNLELIHTAASLGRELVPAQPPILETVLGGNPALWQDQKAEMASRLHDWAAAAEKAGTVIALKAHVGSAVNSPERLLWLLDQVKSPSLDVAYDFSHFQLQGIDMAESMKLLLPRTRFIHVKDSEGDATKFRFLLPGAGRTDYVQYFTLLKEHGYAGPVCVEVSGQVSSAQNYDPVAAARQCHVALSKAMSQVFAG
jgi:inosose dehydratase